MLDRLFPAMFVTALVLAPASTAHAQTPADRDAIIATARNYIDGFYAGDSARMRRSLHPDLAKRRISGQPGSPPNQTSNDLAIGTARNAGRGGTGQPVPADSIRILDLFKDMAMVRIGVPSWVDYLHVAKFGTEWKIINVAWQTRP